VRFETRFDRWLVVLVVLASIVTCVGLPLLAFLKPGGHAPPVWVPILPPVLWLIVLSSTLPQYYEVREDGLFIRQGWRKIFIAYPALAGIESTTDTRSSVVFSSDRLLVSTRDGKRYLIAVVEDDRFISEIGRRSPHLAPREFGLGLRF